LYFNVTNQKSALDLSMAVFKKYLGFTILLAMVFVTGLVLGRRSQPTLVMSGPYLINPFLIQGDPELLPLPGQGQQPGQQPGEVPQDCVLLFQDGQLYRMQPGQGGGMPGFGDGSPELLPLEPVPNIPGMPIPRPSPAIPKGLDS
jgi:hypothetical protein